MLYCTTNSFTPTHHHRSAVTRYMLCRASNGPGKLKLAWTAPEYCRYIAAALNTTMHSSGHLHHTHSRHYSSTLLDSITWHDQACRDVGLSTTCAGHHTHLSAVCVPISADLRLAAPHTGLRYPCLPSPLALAWPDTVLPASAASERPPPSAAIRTSSPPSTPHQPMHPTTS